jgi:hypothetical protein
MRNRGGICKRPGGGSAPDGRMPAGTGRRAGRRMGRSAASASPRPPAPEPARRQVGPRTAGRLPRSELGADRRRSRRARRGDRYPPAGRPRREGGNGSARRRGQARRAGRAETCRRCPPPERQARPAQGRWGHGLPGLAGMAAGVAHRARAAVRPAPLAAVLRREPAMWRQARAIGTGRTLHRICPSARARRSPPRKRGAARGSERAPEPRRPGAGQRELRPHARRVGDSAAPLVAEPCLRRLRGRADVAGKPFRPGEGPALPGLPPSCARSAPPAAPRPARRHGPAAPTSRPRRPATVTPGFPAGSGGRASPAAPPPPRAAPVR